MGVTSSLSLSFLQLVQAIAAIKPKAASPRGANTTKSSVASPVIVFTNWVKELSRRHSSLPPGTALSVFRLLFPEADAERKYSIQETKLSRTLAKVFGVSTNTGGRGRGLVAWMSPDRDTNAKGPKQGCLGLEIQKIMEDVQVPIYASSPPPLTIKTVDNLLTTIAQHCTYSSSTVLSHTFGHSFSAPPTQKEAIRQLFTLPTLSPFGAATVVQIILKDVRPLLYPLPDAAASHYTNALLGWKSNALQPLTMDQALRIWESVMGCDGLARAWKMRGWAAFSLFENGTVDQAQMSKIPDIREVPEQDGFSGDDERANDAPAPRATDPVVGLPVAVRSPLKNIIHFSAISKHLPPSKVGMIWAETKYDGERAQIHVQRVPHGQGQDGGCWKITIYSKSGRDSTFDRAAVHQLILEALGLSAHSSQEPATIKVHNSAIVEAEMVAYSSALGRIDEFWRIRSLIGSTAIGPRRRVPRSRPTKNHAPLVDSQETDVDGTDPNEADVHISVSQASMYSDKSAQGTRHLALVFFDVLHLDGASFVNQPYKTRRSTLERIIKEREGWIMLAQRECVYKAGGSAEQLRRSMAKSIANHEEGLVLKAEEGRYGDWKVPWVKLKKDYIPGHGDCVDLVLVGAGWDKDRARELRVAPSTYTTFYIGALTHTKDVSESGTPPHIEILFSTAYGLSREQLEDLNFVVRNSGKGYIQCEGRKHYYTLRFPRIQKVHRPSERSWFDGVSLQELQDIARTVIGRDRPGKAEDDWCADVWGKVSSPRVRAPERRRDNEETWLARLERADGLSASRQDKTQSESPLKRKRDDRRGPQVWDTDSDEQRERCVKPKTKHAEEFVQGSSKDAVVAVREEEMCEQDESSSQRKQDSLETPFSPRVLGSVTNLIPTPPRTLTRMVDHAPLPTPLTEGSTTPQKQATSSIRFSPVLPRTSCQQDFPMVDCEEICVNTNAVPPIPPTPPSTAPARNNVHSVAPSPSPAYHSLNSFQAFLSSGVIWLARPDEAAVPSWYAAAGLDTPSVPLQNQVHTLDALLYACGWSCPTSCVWAEYGVVFVDDSAAETPAFLWTDPRHPVRLLIERRKTLLTDSAASVRSKPIWVFSKHVLGESADEGSSRFCPESKAICRLG
ncbi:hypothetical protein EIP86_008003 [Pleurotus ostreatoroseus]|nr:hypothetical protein EIP86_008003 [Pleurotus ostreatoroseus]